MKLTRLTGISTILSFHVSTIIGYPHIPRDEQRAQGNDVLHYILQSTQQDSVTYFIWFQQLLQLFTNYFNRVNYLAVILLTNLK
jgi:hypothetical protein